MHRLVLVILCVAALAGCRPTQLAGRSIGQYAVTATLAESSCGDGHPAPPTMSFYVELREEPSSSSGYWKLPEGPLLGGSLSDGAFRFEQRIEAVGVAPEPDLGIVGCTLERAEVVRGEVSAAPLADGGGRDGSAPDGGAPAQPLDAGPLAGRHAILRGETIITVTPVAGGDCSPLLLPLGGAFPVLPCQLRYTLQGEQLDEPLW